MNQICAKVGPALAAGCTMVLKPSELAPLNAMLFAEIMDEAGVPAGVFNLVNGDGPGVGAALSAHPDVDMMSFTGSTRAGKSVMKASPMGIKKVALELGGKSPNIMLDDADLPPRSRAACCTWPAIPANPATRPRACWRRRRKYDEVVAIAAETANAIKVSAPDTAEPGPIGPLANGNQFQKVQDLIQKGIDEGATVAAGGVGRPEGFNRGYFVKPTVFANVNNEMTIAREEIFGPVLCIIPYETEEEAIRIANDTPYGLAAYVQGSPERARKLARACAPATCTLMALMAAWARRLAATSSLGSAAKAASIGLEEFLEVKAAFRAGKRSPDGRGARAGGVNAFATFASLHISDVRRN